MLIVWLNGDRFDETNVLFSNFNFAENNNKMWSAIGTDRSERKNNYKRGPATMKSNIKIKLYVSIITIAH